MYSLKIYVLGPLQVQLDNRPVIHFETNKVRALLAYLAVESDRPHSREFLADLFWPGSTHASGLGNLRYTVSSLRKSLQDRPPHPQGRNEPEKKPQSGCLNIQRESLEFTASGCAWVDVIEFTRLLPANRSGVLPVERLEQAASLYRGLFLEGFSLPDCAAFDEWLLLKREQYNRQMLKTLYSLADYYEGQCDYDRAQHYAWRQVELEPWLEEGYQQLMRVLALGGQRSVAIAQYEVCRKLLQGELGIVPSRETDRIHHLVTSGNLDELRNRQIAPTRSTQPNPPEGAYMQPASADLRQPGSPRRADFVDRMAEMDRLQTCLERSLAGQGQLVFISGEPGSGKTALAEEFTHRALASNPSLIAAAGSCSPSPEGGDPYLPFVEVLQSLTGEFEGYCHPEALSQVMIERLQKALPTSMRTVAEQGSELVGHLLNLQILLRRSRKLTDPEAGQIQSLLSQGQQDHIHQGNLQPALCEQITHVLLSLARSHPLILILDDLQWADRGTLGMLHHLGRRVSISNILILCLYRSADLFLESGKAPHPLEQSIDELLVDFGNQSIDLARSDRRQFVDAYLDRFPNRYSPEFRDQLCRYTNGNPLLTIELVNSLQACGDIRLDEEGCLACAENPAWDIFPPRVKAMMEARFHQLRPVWLRLLQAASLTPRDFIAEVAARMVGVHPQAAIDWLSGPLSRNYPMVEGLGVQHLGGQRLSFYRFQTPLYQTYLYHQLDEVERTSLHERAAAQLLMLYQEIRGDQKSGPLGGPTNEACEELAARLAWHYQQAGLPELANQFRG